MPDQIERYLVEFERSWSERSFARCVEKLSIENQEERQHVLAELVKIDLERRWTSGTRIRLEAYLDLCPELGKKEFVDAELIVAEYEARLLAGESPDVDRLIKRFPHQARQIRRLVSQLDLASLRRPEAARATNSDRGSTEDGEPGLLRIRALPEQFGKFRIIRCLGEGGMGAVYLAEDTKLKCKFALKVPHSHKISLPQALDRFYREARAAAALVHANVCSVLAVDEIDNIHFIQMVYIDGQDLSKRIESNKRLSQRDAAIIISKLAKALEHAHQTGVIHRDLKPSNIRLDERGEPIIMDFGLAKIFGSGDASLTQDGQTMGTPAYMSPEQASGHTKSLTFSCDIYSLGAVMYELLTGRPPFEGSTILAVVKMVIDSSPVPPRKHRRDIDIRLERICLKAMAKRPEHRFASMAEFAGEVDGFLRDVPTIKPDAKDIVARKRVTKHASARATAGLGLLDKASQLAERAKPRRGNKSIKSESERTWRPDARWIIGVLLTACMCGLGAFIVWKWRFTSPVPTNRPPQVKTPDDQVVIAGNKFDLRIKAVDPDRDSALAFTVLEPAGATVDNRGRLTWTPAEDLAEGEVTVRVKVTDGEEPPGETITSFSVRIERPVNQAIVQQQAIHARSASLDEAIGDVSRFASTQKGLANAHPKSMTAASYRRVNVESPLWNATLRWSQLLRDVNAQSIFQLSPRQARRLLIELDQINQIATIEPYSSRFEASREPYIQAVANRLVLSDDANADAGENRIDTALVQFLNRPLMGQVVAITDTKGEQYYLLDDKNIKIHGGLVEFLSIFNRRLDTEKRQIRQREMKGHGRAPHCLLAGHVRKTLENSQDLLTTKWEQVFCELLGEIELSQNVNPRPKLDIYQRTLEIACEGSQVMATAFAAHDRLLKNAGIDRAAKWFIPDDDGGRRAREQAREVLDNLPSVSEARKQVSELMRALESSSDATVDWIAWLQNGDDGQWRCAGLKPAVNDGFLYVVTGDSRAAARLNHIGQLVNGELKLQTGVAESLVEGRPLFHTETAIGPSE